MISEGIYLMAQADEIQVGKFAINGGADSAHGVAEIKDNCFRADLLNILTYIKNWWNNPQGVKQPTRPSVFANSLTDAILQGIPPVLQQQLHSIPDFYGDNTEIGTLKGLLAIRCGRYFMWKSVLGDIILPVPLNNRQRLLIDIMQLNMTSLQGLALKNVSQHVITELSTAGSD